MHKIILMIGRALIVLDAIITIKAGFVEFLNAPGVVVIFISHLMHLQTGLHIVNLYLVCAVVIMVLTHTALFFVISEKICDEVNTYNK